MSTRATYEICGTVFYCHWDGYPAGAVDRLARMIGAHTQPGTPGDIDCTARKHGGWPFAFIRGNDDAELVASHDAIGGTEWRYIVTEDARGELLVEVHACTLSTGTWRPQGSFARIDDYIAARREWDSTPAIVAVAEPTSFGKPRTVLATLDHAEAIASLLWYRGASFDEGNPNRASYLARAEAWRDAAWTVRRAETERQRRAAIAAAQAA